MRDDLLWWITHADRFNGSIPIVEERPPVCVCVDACDTGGGGYFDGHWYHVGWSRWEEAEQQHINYKEVLALAPAVGLWGLLWIGRLVTVYSDNQAVVVIINRGTAKDPFVMSVLRDVFWSSIRNNFCLKALYYPGRQNVVADAASRLSNPGGWNRLQEALSHTLMG